MSDFRPRSNAELLDVMFEIYRRYFLLFMAISVFAAIPTAIASYITDRAVAASSMSSLYESLLVRLVGLAISTFTAGAITVIVSAAYLGRPVDLGQAVRAVFVHPFRLVLTMVYVGVLTGVGLVLFLVPGLIVFKRYFAVLMVLLFEDRGIRASMKRSRELANGNGRRIFALIGGVLLFVTVVAMFLVGALASLLHGVVRECAVLVIYTLLTPFSTIAATLLYYDIRIRKEGYDIELMTQALGAMPFVPEPAV